jgi:L-ascorbate metabolism protein UlaG (beta-lactamase superfamily)
MPALIITLAGGLTALIEAGGFRLLTDPTFERGAPTTIDPR